ncbi:MAG TPA: hypothetical protein VI504_09845 [Candidatus Eisenbacteria bacterium]
MKRTAHLTDALVLELVTGPAIVLPPAATTHLESCTRCATDLRELRELVVHVRDGGTEEPPAALLARVWALMPPAPPKPRMSRLFPLAPLVYDSHAALPSPGLRAVTAVRHLAWRSGGLVIDAEVEQASTGGGGHLMGQVVPEPAVDSPQEPGDVWLEEQGGETHWAPLDPGGEFSLPAPRGRRWSLWIDWGGRRVRLRGA